MTLNFTSPPSIPHCDAAREPPPCGRRLRRSAIEVGAGWRQAGGPACAFGGQCLEDVNRIALEPYGDAGEIDEPETGLL